MLTNLITTITLLIHYVPCISATTYLSQDHKYYLRQLWPAFIHSNYTWVAIAIVESFQMIFGFVLRVKINDSCFPHLLLSVLSFTLPSKLTLYTQLARQEKCHNFMKLQVLELWVPLHDTITIIIMCILNTTL